MPKDESWMHSCVQGFLKRKVGCNFTTKNFQVQNIEFDVVGYDSENKTFHMVECKKGAKAADIGHAFGQLLAYQSVLHQAGYDFLRQFLKSAHANIDLGDMINPVEEGVLQAKFYVGLTDDACDNVLLFKAMKKSLFHVGIIRIKSSGACRNYISVKGEHDYELSQSKLIPIPVRRIFTHSEFLQVVERRLRAELAGTSFEDFKTNKRVDRPYGDWLKIYYQYRQLHFEVVLRKRKYIELALHLEGRRRDNLSLYRYLRKRMKAIRKELGKVNFGSWGGRGWLRVYEHWPRTDLTEQYAQEATRRLGHYIRVLQPMMEEWGTTQ